MDIIANLIARADDLRRSIFVSLPFEVRLAAIFTRLALDSVQTLGRALGATFLLSGVTDMPDPGPAWNPQARRPELTLPPGYMKDFASSVYGLVIKKFGDPSIADEAIQHFLLKVTTTKVIKPVPRRSAESFVRDGVVKAALDIVRQRRRRERPNLSDSLDQLGDEGRSLAEALDDPRALRYIERKLSPRVWRLWMAYLAHELHPDIPAYLGLSMQGFTDAEIIGDPRKKDKPGMLPNYKPPPSGANSFLKSFVYKIPEVSTDFFHALHEELPVVA